MVSRHAVNACDEFQQIIDDSQNSKVVSILSLLKFYIKHQMNYISFNFSLEEPWQKEILEERLDDDEANPANRISGEEINTRMEDLKARLAVRRKRKAS